MEQLGAYTLIIVASLIVIASFLFSEISRRTNVPSVLMLILLGVGLKLGFPTLLEEVDFSAILEILGIVGLIMIVLEAALELKLARHQLVPILKAALVAAAGLMLSSWVAAETLLYFVEGMSSASAWMYATPLSILSSAIIIPSVGGLRRDKKEFEIYESTFSDILGIVVFYFLAGPFEVQEGGREAPGLMQYAGILLGTVLIALVASYALVLVFQRIQSHVKLFLLIAMLLLLYAIGKKFHLSSLIIILVFGLMFANVSLFFFGPFARHLKPERVAHVFEGLHVVTLETAFVVRTFFFVIFGLTIDPASLFYFDVAAISLRIIVSIYVIRYVLLRLTVGRDIFPQLFIAPRGLITVLLFNAIPAAALVEGFQPGILLFVIIGTSVTMTFAMVQDRKRAGLAMRKAASLPVGMSVWQAPSVHSVQSADGTGVLPRDTSL